MCCVEVDGSGRGDVDGGEAVELGRIEIEEVLLWLHADFHGDSGGDVALDGLHLLANSHRGPISTGSPLTLLSWQPVHICTSCNRSNVSGRSCRLEQAEIQPSPSSEFGGQLIRRCGEILECSHGSNMVLDCSCQLCSRFVARLLPHLLHFCPSFPRLLTAVTKYWSGLEQ